MLLTVAGCSTNPVAECVHPQQPTAIANAAPIASALVGQSAQSLLDRTQTLDTAVFYHEIVLDPEKFVAKLDGRARHPTLTIASPVYVLGIEKPRRNGAVPSHSCKTGDYSFASLHALNPDAYKSACATLDDPHPMVLTHIARFDGIEGGELQKPCLLFNTYAEQFACAGTLTMSAQGADLQREGLAALDGIRTPLSGDLEGVTDIVVMSTGWNTHQDESIFGYLDWIQLLQDARPANRPFKPLFVVFTWQSKFDFHHGEITAASIFNKGNDADEIGLRYTTRLLDQVIEPVAKARSIPVTLIGHSFGTRVLGMGLYRKDATAGAAERADPEAFIALQPAFTVNHFDRGKEATFSDPIAPDALVAITASTFDHATSSGDIFHVTYAGGARAVEKSKRGRLSPLISSDSLDDQGQLATPLRSRGIYLIDASAIVNCNWPNTGGGAHSDVFGQPMGRVFWQVITAAQAKP